MEKRNRTGVNRREFLIQSGLAAGAVAAGIGGCASNLLRTSGGRITGVALTSQTHDDSPVKWAKQQLVAALDARRIPVRIVSGTHAGNPDELSIYTERVLLAGHSDLPLDPGAPRFPKDVVKLTRGAHKHRPFLAAYGSDALGTVYALSELTEVVKLSSDPLQALMDLPAEDSFPANPVRSVMRMFCTDIEDKQWFNDRAFWKEYLTMLVSNRFNRFNLSLGLGYDFATQLRDTYFYFAYPFLLDVPGYKVRATNVSNAERDKNLEMLRFISDETVARGMEFQLGIWTHAYVWQNSPNVNHVIEGLTPDKHAAYCQDALALLLKECPNISGVTLRIHGESGVNEGSYDFWKSVFHGAVRADRKIRLDLHAKGIDQGMIDTALATGLPLTVSPKYWAEHMGLPYHQAAIRPTELPTRARGSSDLMALSTGARSFTRYGYGDLLDEDRKFGVLHRMWPGTQRVLLWGDPVFAAAYSRSSSFCGSIGCELMEPMSFKGRKGSGVPGGRDSYADSTLHAPGGDFEKYRYYYRLWGRLLYNPDADPKTWQRQLAKDYGAEAAGPVEQALAHSSRILPLFTTAHTPAAANNNYWPEMYVNQSIVDGARKAPYTETPIPCRFGTISPLDPQMFSRIDDEVQSLIDGKSTGKYTPAEVSQ